MEGYVLKFLQPHRGLYINEQEPERHCWKTKTPFCVPHVLHPDVGTRSEKQPMNGNEKETDHVGSQGDTNEEDGEGQALVFEGVVHTTEQQPKRPQILKTELQDKVCQQDDCPYQQELDVQKCAAAVDIFRNLSSFQRPSQFATIGIPSLHSLGDFRFPQPVSYTFPLPRKSLASNLGVPEQAGVQLLGLNRGGIKRRMAIPHMSAWSIVEQKGIGLTFS